MTVAGAAACETLDQAAREHRRDQGVAMRRGPDAEQELFRTRVLQQETSGTGAQRVENVLTDVEGSEHHHPGRVRAERDDPPGRLEAIHPGHPDIHEYDVRARPGHLANRRDPVLGLADHLKVGLSLDEHADTGAHQRLVIGDQDPDRHERAGSQACTENPPPGRGPACRLPPSS